MFFHLLQTFKVTIFRCSLSRLLSALALFKMIDHFSFCNWNLAEWTLLNILNAVVVVQLKRFFGHLLWTSKKKKTDIVVRKLLKLLWNSIWTRDTYQLSQRISGSSAPRVTNVPSEFLSALSYAFTLIYYWRLFGLEETYSVSSLFSSLSLAMSSFASLSCCFNWMFSSSRNANLSESNWTLEGRAPAGRERAS